MELEYNTKIEVGQDAIGDFFDADKFDWIGHRSSCGKIARRYEIGGDIARANKVAGCATALDFGVNTEAKRILRAANFCQLRLCPMCMARRARKNALRLSRVMDKVEVEHPGVRYIFLTLTVRNCGATDLRKTLHLLTDSWGRFRRCRHIEASVRGWFRALEITHTYRLGPQLEYHPHLHAILAVEPSYFTGYDYLTHKELVGLWRQSLRVDYDPVVGIQSTKDKRGNRRGEAAAKEAAKYTVKESQILVGPDMSEEARVLMDLTKALDRKRLLAYGGWLKAAAAALDIKSDDDENGDLVHLDETECRKDVFILIECYRWDFLRGTYALTDTFEP